MEELFHLLGDLHVLGEVETADVGRGDDAVSRQLPDVELVHRQDTLNLIKQNFDSQASLSYRALHRYLCHEFLLKRVDLDVGGDGLQEDEGGLDEKWPD